MYVGYVYNFGRKNGIGKMQSAEGKVLSAEGKKLPP